jgi:GNAT superfamily N-acetyltransferase
MTLIVRESTKRLAEQLDAELSEFNERCAGPLQREQLALAIREGEHLLAGLSGEIFWNALYVHALWVAEQHRHQGYGRALLMRAEELARERGCDVVHLSTFEFQAPDFYTALGYRPFGELVGVPRGSRRIWFAKALRPNELKPTP